MKMFLDGLCDIGFWCLNLRIEGNEYSHDMELKNQDLKTQVQRHEVKSKFEEGVDKSASLTEYVHRWLV